MSAPHSLSYDVLFNGDKISSFDLDVDLDNPSEVFEGIYKLFKTESVHLMLKFYLDSLNTYIILHLKLILLSKISGANLLRVRFV